jgi:hypothetical protein
MQVISAVLKMKQTIPKVKFHDKRCDDLSIEINMSQESQAPILADGHEETNRWF